MNHLSPLLGGLGNIRKGVCDEHFGAFNDFLVIEAVSLDVVVHFRPEKFSTAAFDEFFKLFRRIEPPHEELTPVIAVDHAKIINIFGITRSLKVDDDKHLRDPFGFEEF